MSPFDEPDQRVAAVDAAGVAGVDGDTEVGNADAPATAAAPVDGRLLLPATATWVATLLGRLAPTPLVVGCGIAAVVLALALAVMVAVAMRNVGRTGGRTGARTRGRTSARTGRRMGGDHPCRRAAAWVAVGSLSLGAAGLVAGAVARHATAGPLGNVAAGHGVATLDLRLTSDPSPRHRGSGTGVSASYVVAGADVLRLRSGGRTWSLHAPVTVIGPASWTQAAYGSVVHATGRLQLFDDHGDVGFAPTGPPRVVAAPGPIWRAAAHVRAGLRDAVADRPPDVRALVPALVLGDDAGLPDEVVAQFRATGLTHLSAVSGTNLTLLLAFVLPVARLVGVRRSGIVVVGVVCIAVFVVLARPQPSVLRAAVMGLVAVTAVARGGSGREARTLSAAVIVLLLLHPVLAVNAGFALSVLATAGLVLLGPGWRDALSGWLPVRVAEAVATPLAAQLACTPVVAAISGQVSWVAVLANLLAEPAVGPATVLGFATAGVAVVWPWAAVGLGWLATWPAHWILWVAAHTAALPGAATTWPAGPLALVGLSVTSLVTALVLPAVLRRRRLCLALAAVLAVWLLLPR